MLKLLVEQEWDKIKNFISSQNHNIVQEYLQVNIISEYDIITLLLIYCTLDLKMLIPKFIGAITNNKAAHKIKLPLIIDQILACLDESIGNKVIIHVWNYMFTHVTHIERGTRELLDEQVVECHKSAHTENGELLCNFLLRMTNQNSLKGFQAY